MSSLLRSYEQSVRVSLWSLITGYIFGIYNFIKAWFASHVKNVFCVTIQYISTRELGKYIKYDQSKQKIKLKGEKLVSCLSIFYDPQPRQTKRYLNVFLLFFLSIYILWKSFDWVLCARIEYRSWFYQSKAMVYIDSILKFDFFFLRFIFLHTFAACSEQQLCKYYI